MRRRAYRCTFLVPALPGLLAPAAGRAAAPGPFNVVVILADAPAESQRMRELARLLPAN